MIKKILPAVLFIFLTPWLSATDFYWEEPQVFFPRQGSFPISAYSENFSAIAWQESIPNRGAGATGGQINIHLAVKNLGDEWIQRGLIAGPYSYSGTEPSIISLVIDNRGRIIIAAATGGAQTEILISNDRGLSFSRNLINLGSENSVAPRIFVRADGGYLLFITRGHSAAMALHYSRSNDGINWLPFEVFVPENAMALNFLPVHKNIGNRDIVFFQSLVMDSDDATTFQLYYKISTDNGATWSTARRFTTFRDPVMYTNEPAGNFDNQRPHLTRYGDNLFIVWERRYLSQSPQIYGAIVNQDMDLISRVDRINTEEAYCNNPIGFLYNGEPTVVWFDNRRGNNRIILAQRMDFGWQNHQLSSATSEASFARPVVDRDGAYVFWQGAIRGSGRIYLLAPDRSVSSPRLTAVNFNPARPGRSERVRVSWNIPFDTSGILGFSWEWSQAETAEPPKQVMIFNTGNIQDLNLEQYADRDGQWFFSVRAHDFAGNWSEPARIGYFRKTTPPPPLTIIPPSVDNNGFLVSNTFNMSWEPSDDPFLAGYTWGIQYLGTNANLPVSAPPSRIMGAGNSVRFNNYDDGLWAFSVSAIDHAGNIGEPSNIIFNLNKFIPYTSVSFVDYQQDEQGSLSIRLVGRGFTTNGQITSIVLEQENRPGISGTFNILSDREISGLHFENLEEGDYNLRLEHSARGWYTARSAITVARSATVKFGDYTQQWRPSWTIQPRKLIMFNPVMLLAAVLIIFCALGFIAAIRGIGGIIAESTIVKQEALAIITGEFMPMEKKQKMIRVQKRGSGLRLKLASFTIALVLSVIVMISTPMYIIMTRIQRETLLQGLYDRSKVLLEGLASNVRAHLPQGDQGILELGFLPAQSAALPEANYVTITGVRSGSVHSDHVWATNDPDIITKIDTVQFRPGVSRITDAFTPRYEELRIQLNDQARVAAADLSRSILEFTQEAMTIGIDGDGMQRLSDIQVTIRSLEVRLAQVLAQVAGEIGTEPEFSLESILRDNIREFIFFKPVMYRQGADENYFRGLIRLEVSLDSIMDNIAREQLLLLRTILYVALAALLLGIAGAFILSSLIIRPIKKLVRHIEVIRDTDDKTKLEGVDINIATKDELAVLGKTINDMTHGLVKAALAASDLSIGKEIQKKFIPLDMDSQGNKQSSGFKKTQNLNFFGYYEGAKGVSGDYFDYRDLDGRYYAIIKCDVAGKGIPAALIMIQVATMFLNYFKQWKPNAKGMKIEEVVYQINDFIETLAFKGRFAAFTLCLFDSETGIVRFCNAGDNIVHLYDASEGKLKTITLPTTPATGVLPNFMIESTGGYKVQTITVDPGDILLLYTDGIEEAKRRFRNSDFKEILCSEGPVNTPHENHLSGQADEEMSPERVEAIINAVMAREIYTLRKFHNPEGDETELQFDFSTCEGRVEEVIMAMVSVEKMFRCYKAPNAGEDSRIPVDKKVDEFLKSHFLQYRRYCAHTKEFPENDAYMYYTHVKEDEQYDDLTILGIKRKEK
jgi:hypothetical protein